MEEITDGVNNININNSNNDLQKKNRIQVSNTKKPLFFYVNLAKRYMQQHNEVELSALGMGGYLGARDNYVYCLLKTNLTVCYTFSEFLLAIATVVSVAEILKNNGLAVEKRIVTSTVEIKDDSRGRPVQKAKIEIVLGKSAKFDELMAASQEERENEGKAGQSGNGEEQS